MQNPDIISCGTLEANLGFFYRAARHGDFRQIRPSFQSGAKTGSISDSPVNRIRKNIKKGHCNKIIIQSIQKKLNTNYILTIDNETIMKSHQKKMLNFNFEIFL